jgi:hypothetical protein
MDFSALLLWPRPLYMYLDSAHRLFADAYALW